jgi:3-phenylpropionate/trans-cinnamate dioxygenase ferredoxin reductase subunit
VIVGAGVAGVRTGRALRDNGFSDEIVLVSAEDELPYDRPPLSKEFLRGSIGDEEIRLLPDDAFAAAGIELELGVAACALNTDAREVDLDDGRRLSYTDLVIATGAQPRRLAGVGELAGIHYLRSARDARALRQALGGRPRVAIIGGGFIGLEVAAVAASLGARVTVVEALDAPLAAVLGTELGTLVRSWHEERGVVFECGVGVTTAAGGDRVEAIELADGRLVQADVVVVGVGIEPNVGWLRASGVELHRGAVCDAEGRTSAPRVWAVGDASCRHVCGRCVRSEHWTAANDHAQRAAGAITGAAARPEPPETYFWSDQYDVRLQFVGAPMAGGAPVIESGDPGERRFVAVCRDGGRTTAIFAVNSPREFVRARAALARDASAQA